MAKSDSIGIVSFTKVNLLHRIMPQSYEKKSHEASLICIYIPHVFSTSNCPPFTRYQHAVFRILPVHIWRKNCTSDL